MVHREVSIFYNVIYIFNILYLLKGIDLIYITTLREILTGTAGMSLRFATVSLNELYSVLAISLNVLDNYTFNHTTNNTCVLLQDKLKRIVDNTRLLLASYRLLLL